MGSLHFYGSWKLSYLGLLLAGTLIDGALAIAIDASQSQRRRFQWLLASLLSNTGALFFFKYYDFFSNQIDLAVGNERWLPALHLALPIGISFYLFQSTFVVFAPSPKRAIITHCYRVRSPADHRSSSSLHFLQARD